MRTLEVEGTERRYLISVPGREEPPDGWPLMLMLHGGGGSPESFRSLSLMDIIGEREGFVTVYGDSLAVGWTAGEGSDPTGLAELPYLDAVLAEVRGRVPINDQRMYVAGHSNGGEMAYVLVQNRPGVFAGMARVNSPLLVGFLDDSLEGCQHVLLFRGTADPLVPIEGGEVADSGRIAAPFSDAFQWYGTEVGVSDLEPTVTQIPQVEPDDSTSTTKSVFGPSEKGSVLALYLTQNGGHGWPGSPGGLPVSVIGITAQDFDASEEIWAFFEDKTLIESRVDGWRIY